MDNEKRGIQIINAAELFKVSAKDKRGQKQQVGIDNQYLRLSYMDKLMMYEKCPPVLGVVTSRANRMSTLDYSVVPTRQIEDEIASKLKEWRDIYHENERPGLFYGGKRIRAFQEIRRYLSDVFPDLTNFDASLKRWAKDQKRKVSQSAAEVEDFFARPNPGMLWNEFIKIITQDMLVHGAGATYKKDGNLYPLPGGTVYPIRSQYVGGPSGFVQIPVWGDEPQLFFKDELAYAQYMPNSNVALGISARYQVWARGYGLVDSAKSTATPGMQVNITAVPAPNDAAGAKYYPAIYWYSMLKIPSEDQFGKDPGIGKGMTQVRWLDGMKSNGCVGCHQLGQESTRTIPRELGTFASSADAWRRRVQSGQAGQMMLTQLTALGPLSFQLYGDWTDRLARGEFRARSRRVRRAPSATSW